MTQTQIHYVGASIGSAWLDDPEMDAMMGRARDTASDMDVHMLVCEVRGLRGIIDAIRHGAEVWL